MTDERPVWTVSHTFSVVEDAAEGRWFLKIEHATGRISLNPDIPQDVAVIEFVRLCDEMYSRARAAALDPILDRAVEDISAGIHAADSFGQPGLILDAMASSGGSVCACLHVPRRAVEDGRCLRCGLPLAGEMPP